MSLGRKIDFKKERTIFTMSGLFLVLVLFFIKEFSDKVWGDIENGSIPYQNTSIPDTISQHGGYENIWNIGDNKFDKKILPENRIIAYYGNLSSKQMGILGEYDEDEVLTRLLVEVKKWDEANPEIPAIPALHYIATVAQSSPGKDNKYRLRMGNKQIERVLAMASKINALVFLDIQVGGSDLQTEIPRLKKYLELPHVHLGIDPEFALPENIVPGSSIGTLDASDINFAIGYLSEIVSANNLAPKVLVVHRFTDGMITNYGEIKPSPQVQVVINMDGFGPEALKKNTYKQYVGKNPIDFTGFKIFYKNDLWTEGSKLLQPEDLLKLNPVPVYIQYQ